MSILVKIVILIVLIAIIFNSGFAEIATAGTINKQAQLKLIQYMQKLQPKISKQRAELLVQTCSELSTEYKISPYLVLAMIWQESGFRNIYGDNGDALGYGQIHQSAFQYLQLYYSKLDLIQYSDLVRLPKLQVE